MLKCCGYSSFNRGPGAIAAVIAVGAAAATARPPQRWRGKQRDQDRTQGGAHARPFTYGDTCNSPTTMPTATPTPGPKPGPALPSYMVLDGCPSLDIDGWCSASPCPQDADSVCVAASSLTAGVRCCNMAGTSGNAYCGAPCQLHSQAEAFATCLSNGMRLCMQTEILAGVVAGTPAVPKAAAGLKSKNRPDSRPCPRRCVVVIPGPRQLVITGGLI